jgi:hypothetical protein
MPQQSQPLPQLSGIGTTSQQAQQLQAAELPQEPAAAAAAGADGGQTAAPELNAKQLAAAKDLARQILLEEEQQRTRELVDSAWQSLE